jgi:hypothetical protein
MPYVNNAIVIASHRQILLSRDVLLHHSVEPPYDEHQMGNAMVTTLVKRVHPGIRQVIAGIASGDLKLWPTHVLTAGGGMFEACFWSR